MLLTVVGTQPAMAVEPNPTDGPAPAAASESIEATGPAIYLIRLSDPPLTTYRGGIAGLEATNPKVRGERKLDVNSPASQAYLEYLAAQQAQFIAGMEQVLGRSVEVKYHYTIANNGLAVWLSPDEAETVAQMPGVDFIQRNFERELHTDASVAYMGAPGIWDGSETGGLPGTMGEGMIIGVIDTGITWQNPSFAEVGPVDGYVHVNPFPTYLGNCEPGSPHYQDICNDKLIGAYGYAGNGYDARDYHGHGSHTSSISGGNIVDITDPVTAQISGVAPHANIIHYASCCAGDDLSASIDDAIADGVDVINYSIGSSSPSDVWNDFDTVGYLNAREVGIFVATSAGNDGPAPDTVGSPADAPWLTAVGNHNHTRVWANTGDVTGPTPVPPELEGLAIVNGELSPEIVAPIENDIIWSGDVDPANVLGCDPFPAGAFDDAIALILRGDCNFSVKEENAADAGAIAMVVYNHSAGPPIVMGGAGAIIPSVFMSQSDGLAVVAWIQANVGPTFRINPGTNLGVNTFWPNIIAAGSSRGANRALPDIVKPDVASFGTSVLAALETGDNIGWGFMSGTSMASPHAAGSAALLMDLHPDWTPAEVQSALMTTAWNDMLKEDGLTAADAFDIGSGRIQLGPAAQAGLVLDESIDNYWAADPAIGGDPKTLNLASMGNDACVGVCTWERTVRSTLSTAQDWEVSATSVPTISLEVSPAAFTLDPGMIQTIVITADVSGAPGGEWFFGEVVISPAMPVPARSQGSQSLEEKLAADANAVPSVGGNAPFAVPAAIPDNAYIGVGDGNDGFGEDAGMVCDDIDTSSEIPGGTPVASVDAQLAIDHTWIGDLTVKLMSPDGTIVAMMERVQGSSTSNVEDGDTGTGCCGDSDDMVSTSPINLADAYPTDSEDMGLPGGVVCEEDGVCDYWPNPDQALLVGSSAADFAAYNGEEASGVWRLCAADSASGDEGTLQGWTLCVNGTCFSRPEAQEGVPAAHLPVAVRAGAADLPDLVEIVTDQHAGTQTVEDLLALEDITDLTVEEFGLALADRTEGSIFEDPTNGDPYDNLDDVMWFTSDVPAGAMRFVAEVIKSESPDLDMFVGTGDTPSLDTQVCVSAGGGSYEYCNINDPAEGTWWVLVQNFTGSGDQPDLVVMASGAVDDVDNGNMTVTGPASVPGGTPFDLDVNWDEPSMVGQDRWYGAFTIGTDPGNPGNVGTINVNLEFVAPLLTKEGPAMAATGDVISYTITLEVEGGISDMAFMTDTLPAGVEYAGNLTYTYGMAWYDDVDDAVYWSSAVPGAAAAASAPTGAGSSVALTLESTPARGPTAAAPAPLSPDEPVELILDDGTHENNIGIGGNWEMIFVNHFSPDAGIFPFDLNEIQIYFDGGTVVAGDDIILVVYQDADGDPSNGAEWLASYPTTVQAVDTWNSFTLSTPVTFAAPTDVLIGAIALELPGVSYYPAAIDTTASQMRSWAGWWSVSPPPDPPTLPPDDTWMLIDGYLPGNWLVRGYGEYEPAPETVMFTFDVTVTAEGPYTITNIVDLDYEGEIFPAETSCYVPGVGPEYIYYLPIILNNYE
jgi:subtilisin-like proprotein convertase family protein